MAHEIRVPRLGWSMEEGTFVGWLKRPGQPVAAGEPLFELEGDKALEVIEAVDAGLLDVPDDAPPPGSVVAVGTLLGYLLAAGEPRPAGAPREAPGANSPAPGQCDATRPGPAGETPPPARFPAKKSLPPVASPAVRRLARARGLDWRRVPLAGELGRVTRDDFSSMAVPDRLAAPAAGRPTAVPISTPRARRVAAELGIEWRTLTGSGRGGRIREADVRQAAERVQIGAATASHDLLTPRRRAIAARLRHSHQQTVPVTLVTSADATHLVALREQFKAATFELVPSYAEIFVCLVARVLGRHPRLAVRWEGEPAALIAVPGDEFHVGLAVDTPAGLLVPVIRQVSTKPLGQVAREARALVERARAGRLSGAEMHGAVLTVSNLGGYAIDAFTPVIDYPQISILGLGAIRDVPELTGDGRLVARPRITLSLTFDHAAVDGAPAAAFLQDLAQALAQLVPTWGEECG